MRTYDDFGEYSTEILKLRKARKLHPVSNRNMKELFETHLENVSLIGETNTTGGRKDAILFFISENKTMHFEIFASKGQVPQDLRLLENSKHDEQVAIIIDKKVDGSVEKEYFHKNPENKFRVFRLSDLFLEERRKVFLERIKNIGDEIINKETSQKAKLRSAREFHETRVAKISRGEGYYPTKDKMTFIFHLIPSKRVIIRDQFNSDTRMLDFNLYEGVIRHRMHNKGYLWYLEDGDGYSLLHDDGCLEAISSYYVRIIEGITIVSGSWYKRMFYKVLRNVIDYLTGNGIDPPFFLLLTIIKTKNSCIELKNPWNGNRSKPIHDDDLFFKTLVYDGNLDYKELIQPWFDRIYQSYGLPKDPGYSLT